MVTRDNQIAVSHQEKILGLNATSEPADLSDGFYILLFLEDEFTLQKSPITIETTLSSELLVL